MHEKATLMAKINNLDTTTASPTWHRRYTRFASNVRIAIPHLTHGQLPEQFRHAVLNRQLSFLDERFHREVSCRWVGDGGAVVAGLLQRPAIVGTFHTGSYRLLVHELVRRKVPVALLVGRAVRQKQAGGYRDALAEAGYPASALSVIEAEHPAAGIQLIRALRRGRSVVGYLDGNLGSGMQPELLTVPFLAAHMSVRIGLAWLAGRAGVPFIGVLCRRTCHGMVEWQPRMLIEGAATHPRLIAEGATRQLYRGLADMVAAEPWQWDNWLYVHENYCHIGRIN